MAAAALRFQPSVHSHILKYTKCKHIQNLSLQRYTQARLDWYVQAHDVKDYPLENLFLKEPLMALFSLAATL